MGVDEDVEAGHRLNCPTMRNQWDEAGRRASALIIGWLALIVEGSKQMKWPEKEKQPGPKKAKV